MRKASFFLFFFTCINFLNGQVPKNKGKDSSLTRGIFVSLNFSFYAVDSVPPAKDFYYFVFTGEVGKWIHKSTLVALQGVTSILSGGAYPKRNYTPYELSVLMRTFPFYKNRKLRWLALQGQIGIANSCMYMDDPKMPLFPIVGVGPVFNVRLGKKKVWALNCVYLSYYSIGVNCPPNFGSLNLRGYVGVNYTF